MNRLLKVGLIISMLLLFAAPGYVRADDTSTSNKTPYDWLNTDEKAYVDQARSYIADAHQGIADLKNELIALSLTDAWYNEYLRMTGACSLDVEIFVTLQAPDEFSEVQQGFNAMASEIANGWIDIPNFSQYEYEGFLDPDHTFTLINAVAAVDGFLSGASGKLNAMSGKLEARVQEVGKGQELANQVIGGLFNCSSSRPAPAYSSAK